MLLEDRIILITGAAGGLGAVAALTLAQAGATIIMLDKNLAGLERVYDQLLENKCVEPILYPFDLAGASEQEYDELAQRIEQKYGVLHGLLHSAVELSAFTPLSQFETQSWGHTLNVNLNAPFLLTRVLLPVMQSALNASIVFTSDSAARLAPAYTGAYGISKIALEGLADVLSQELKTAAKIRVNILIPQPINSPLRRRAYPAEDKSRLPSMDSLAPLYRYLFSDASLGMTGQRIDVSFLKQCNSVT
jgi:NAD(P)-dependent dehydrogenase (short-subunit alcohol dehydrogenase family)